MIHFCRFLCNFFFWTLQIPFVLHNTTHGSCIKVTIFIYGWCQAICSKLRCQMWEFPWCFPNIPNFWPVVYLNNTRSVCYYWEGQLYSPNSFLVASSTFTWIYLCRLIFSICLYYWFIITGCHDYMPQHGKNYVHSENIRMCIYLNKWHVNKTQHVYTSYRNMLPC